MLRQIRTMTTLVLVLILLTGLFAFPAYGDAQKTDEELIAEYRIPDNWARPALVFAVRNGLLTGKTNGLCPTDPITRAEVAAILMRLVGTQAAADLSSFTDVRADAWYYDYMARAVAAGIFSGSGNGTLRPNANITRQEAVTVICSLIGLTGGLQEELKDYQDGSQVSAWARDSVMPMVHAGYLTGSGGRLYPGRTITRQEFVQILYSILDGIGLPNGKKGSFILSADEVPDGTQVNGDLILCSEAERICLNNVTVTGRLVLQGSGALSLELNGCTVDTLVLCRPTGLTAQGSTVSRLVTCAACTVRADCTQLEIHADTVFYGKAASAAVVKGKLTVSSSGRIGKTYDASTYRSAQAVQRVRIQGGTIRQCVLYRTYLDGGTYKDPIRTLPKGEKFTFYTRYESSARVRLNDGTEGYLRYNDIYVMSDNYYTTTAYSAAVRECFVNYLMDYQSSGDYLIWINRRTLKLTVFSGKNRSWSVLHTYNCAIGKNSSPTVEGNHSVSKKQARYEASEFYYHHVTFFGGAFAMHSRLYNYDGTFYDDSMSTTVSHGCVRLEDENAIWIYDHIPIATTVVVY